MQPEVMYLLNVPKGVKGRENVLSFVGNIILFSDYYKNRIFFFLYQGVEKE